MGNVIPNPIAEAIAEAPAALQTPLTAGIQPVIKAVDAVASVAAVLLTDGALAPEAIGAAVAGETAATEAAATEAAAAAAAAQEAAAEAAAYEAASKTAASGIRDVVDDFDQLFAEREEAYAFTKQELQAARAGVAPKELIELRLEYANYVADWEEKTVAAFKDLPWSHQQAFNALHESLYLCFRGLSSSESESMLVKSGMSQEEAAILEEDLQSFLEENRQKLLDYFLSGSMPP